MRITTSQLSRNILFNLSENAAKADRYARQMSSGKRVNVPSDDPNSAIKILHLKTALLEAEQYSRNIEDGQGWLQTTETALNGVEQIISDAQALAISASNGALPQGAREALAKQADEMYNQMLQQANMMYGNRYLFGGWKTLTKPYTSGGAAVTYNGDDKQIMREIGFGQRMPINLPGEAVFGPPPGLPGAPGIFDTLTDLRADIRTGNVADLSGHLSADLNALHDNVLAQLSEVGSRVARLDQTKDRLLDAKVNFTDLLEKEEGVDVIEATMNLKILENARTTTLATTAQLIKTTLVDFLR
ncbi:MAG TPA: flagellar hook-associated protein FlgL [Bacillota bacterium]